MTATADAIDSRAYRVAPTQRRGEALLLVGPAVLYLIAFSVYPLVTSLIRSFESYDPRTTSKAQLPALFEVIEVDGTYEATEAMKQVHATGIVKSSSAAATSGPRASL